MLNRKRYVHVYCFSVYVFINNHGLTIADIILPFSQQEYSGRDNHLLGEAVLLHEKTKERNKK